MCHFVMNDDTSPSPLGGTDGSPRPNVLVACSGSVATIKIPEITSLLSRTCNVRLVTTASAQHFFSVQEIAKDVHVYTDDDEWVAWKNIGDPVVHIELRKWADVMLVAPASANTLAKIANGLSDNLLTCVVRAWEFSKPLIICPAMNTFMWDNPFTARHLDTIKSLSPTVEVIDPVVKTLACGDTGQGALAAVPDIVARTCARAAR